MIMDRAVSARRPHWMLWSLVTLGVLLVGLFAGSLLTTNGWSPFGRPNAPFYMVSDQHPDQTVNLNSGFSAIAKAVTPAVVTIVTSSRVRPQPPFPFFDNPFWEFFRRSQPNQDNDGG